MLEELSGNSKFCLSCTRQGDIKDDFRSVWHDVLSNSIPKLPNLQHLNVFKGEALEGTGDVFRVHCPLFKSVKFYGWYAVLPQSP